MKFIKQQIKDLYLIKPEGFKDKRGMLRRHFCQNEFKVKNINFKIKQTNISENYKKFTLRGFHYQKEPYGEDKVISCIKGFIFSRLVPVLIPITILIFSLITIILSKIIINNIF